MPSFFQCRCGKMNKFDDECLPNGHLMGLKQSDRHSAFKSSEVFCRRCGVKLQRSHTEMNEIRLAQSIKKDLWNFNAQANKERFLEGVA